MTQLTHALSPRATTAIAAVLALTATPLLAQDAAPIESAAAPVSEPAPPAAAPQSERTVVSEPVVQQVPPAAAPVADPAPADSGANATVAAAPVAAAPAGTRSPATARNVSRSRSPVAAPAAVPGTAPVIPLQAGAVPETAAMAAPGPALDAAPPAGIAEPAPLAAPDEPADNSGLALAGLLAAFGLGGTTIAMRRRRRTTGDPVPQFERPVVEPMLAEPAPVARFKPLIEPDVAARPATQPVPAVIPAAAPLANAPRERSSDGVGSHDDVLAQMVAAAPDAANPFTSGKARRRRARLILQSQAAQACAPTASDRHNEAAKVMFDFRQAIHREPEPA